MPPLCLSDCCCCLKRLLPVMSVSSSLLLPPPTVSILLPSVDARHIFAPQPVAPGCLLPLLHVGNLSAEPKFSLSNCGCVWGKVLIDWWGA